MRLQDYYAAFHNKKFASRPGFLAFFLVGKVQNVAKVGYTSHEHTPFLLLKGGGLGTRLKISYFTWRSSQFRHKKYIIDSL